MPVRLNETVMVPQMIRQPLPSPYHLLALSTTTSHTYYYQGGTYRSYSEIYYQDSEEYYQGFRRTTATLPCTRSPYYKHYSHYYFFIFTCMYIVMLVYDYLPVCVLLFAPIIIFVLCNSFSCCYEMKLLYSLVVP